MGEYGRFLGRGGGAPWWWGGGGGW